jgi:two-component system response regulator AtoC
MPTTKDDLEPLISGEDYDCEDAFAEEAESVGRDEGVIFNPPASFPSSMRKVFFGSNPYMRDLQRLVARIGPSQAPVLVEGETGVGKEVLARELHAQSTRTQQRFLKLNCAALPSELVESELFGYERGAFTGAHQRKLGMFELANRGTIFLDEIGDMELKLQAKLLQVLQDQEFQRLGGREVIKVDVRILAATHRDLKRAIVDGRFREDLYYRLNVFTLCVPPLRERREDILALADILLSKHATGGAPIPKITPVLAQALTSYRWPGNIRELENIMRRFLILMDSNMIVRDLSQRNNVGPEGSNGNMTYAHEEQREGEPTILGQVTRAKHQAERTAILAALDATQWNRKRAAILLKIHYKALLYKMRKLSIEDKMAVLPSKAIAAAGQ